MSQFYFNPERETETYSLPDAEVFFRTEEENKDDGWLNDDGEPLEAGWYYWACFPGCLPDSDPCGPFANRAEAIADAQEDF